MPNNTIDNQNSLDPRIISVLDVANLVSMSLSIDETLQKSVDLIVSRFGYNSAVIFENNPSQKLIYSKTFTNTKLNKITTKIIPSSFSQLNVSYDKAQNLIVRTILEKKYFINNDLSLFITPVVSEKVAQFFQKTTFTNTVISLPIIYGEKALGAIMFTGGGEVDFSKDIDILKIYSQQIAIAIYNSQLFSQSQNQIVSLENQNRDLASLFNLTSNVSKSLDPYQVGQIAVNSIPSGEMIGGMALTIYNPKTDDLVVAAINHNRVYDQVSKFTGRMEGLRINNKDPDTQQNPGIIAFNTKQEYFSDNVGLSMSPPLPKRFVGPILKLAPVKSSYNIPIKVRGEIVGVISFYLKTKTRQELTDNFIQLLRTYANQIGIALDNAYLFSKSQKTQRNLEKAIKDLQEARRKEKDMIDVMGHELRTPISIVRNSLLVLEADSKKNGTIAPDKLGKYLDMAIESTKREIRLIETLLSTAKLEGKRIQLNLTQISMNDVIKDSVEGNRSQLETKNLELRLNIPQDVPVYADRTRVQEIMDNLLSNALKYTAQGNVTISLYEEGDFARVDVSDTGVGISPEDLNKLGKKFFRAQTSFSGDFKGVKPGGTGLGLYVTFELIRVMGGQHHIQSTKGQGSTFSFNLPLYKGQPDQHIDQTFMNE